MSTQEYIRLDYLKQRGCGLAIGDEYLFYPKHYIVGGKLLRELSAQSEYDADRLITHFEFRDNKSELDLPDDFPIEAVFNGSDTLKKYNVGDVRCFGFGVKHWRPDYDALLKQQQDHDAIESLRNTYKGYLSETTKALWELAEEIEGCIEESEGKCSPDTASGKNLNLLVNSVGIIRQHCTEPDIRYSTQNNGLDNEGNVKYMPEEEALKLLSDCIDKIEKEKEMTKLTSKDIEWQEGMICAVVSEIKEITQLEYKPKKREIHGWDWYDDKYLVGYHYIVEREQDVPK